MSDEQEPYVAGTYSFDAADVSWTNASMGEHVVLVTFADTKRAWWKRLLVRLHLRKPEPAYWIRASDASPDGTYTIQMNASGIFTVET